MRVSYEWLKEYVGEKMPASNEIADMLAFHSFEVEGVEEVDGDTVIDVDVLPNRASDCLSHLGIAREIAAIIDTPLQTDPLQEKPLSLQDASSLSISVDDEERCPRYSAAIVRDVKVGPSPAWLARRLERIGQRSISNIVDATNYVMFSLGQPLHAFDADKLTEEKGARRIVVRRAKAGEQITTLDNTDYELDTETLLITDGVSEKPLGLAGIKGGKEAEVDSSTKNIIIEAANFNPVTTRRTSRALKLRTDASLRFEQGPSALLTLYALRDVTKLITEIAGGACEGVLDAYPKPQEEVEVLVTVDEINSLLGSDMTEQDVEHTLSRLDFSHTHRRGNFTVTVPFERMDLRIPEDMIEEVGRIYGYEHIPAVVLPALPKSPALNKRFYYTEKVRKALSALGFSEVYTYTLYDEGEVKLANPLAADKSALRPSLVRGLSESLALNAHNAPLLGLDTVKLFELGSVFHHDEERTELGLGVRGTESAEAVIAEASGKLSEALGMGDVSFANEGDVYTLDFDALIEKLPEPKSYDFGSGSTHESSYAPISPYPFALRDVAIWTPSGTQPEDVIAVIKKEAGELLVNHSLFDTFEKDGRTSYAFHLVFQSYEKTLSEEELIGLMQKITGALNIQKDWNVR